MAHVEAHNWREGLSLLQRIKYMMEGQYACDVTLKAGQGKHQESIKAHSFILIAGSPYFEALIERDPNAKQDALVLDTSPVIMKEIIKFFYREEVDLHSSNGLELLVASKKYEIPQLAQQCSQFLEANLTPENLSTILTQSLTNGEIKLADECVKLISQNTKEVFGSVEFPSMSRSALMRVVESDILFGVTEMEVYHACLKWADQQCRVGGREVSGKNRREVLADTIYQIRFPTMSSVQFADLAGETSLLTLSEQTSIFQQIALIPAGKATSTSTQFIARKRTSTQLSAWKQSGLPPPPPQLSAGKQSGLPPPSPQLSAGEQSGPPSPPPQLSAGKQSGLPPPSPQLSAGEQSEVPTDTIYQIRFPTTSSVQFAEHAGETSLLTPSEQASGQFIAKKRMQVSPQLSAGKQSGPTPPPPQLSSDKKSGPRPPSPQLSIDKQSGPPRPPPQLSSDKKSGPPRPPPQLSSGKKSGPRPPSPQLSTGKQSGPPRPPPQLSSDKKSGPRPPPPQLSSDKQSGPRPPPPQLSSDKQSGPRPPSPQLSSDKQSVPPRPPPQLSSDKQSGPRPPPPQLSSDKQSGPRPPPPQLSSDKQSGPRPPPPQLSSDKQSDPRPTPPQLSSDKQSVPPRPPPQLSSDKQSGPPPQPPKVN